MTWSETFRYVHCSFNVVYLLYTSAAVRLQRQVWPIPSADECEVYAGKTVRSLENVCHT